MLIVNCLITNILKVLLFVIRNLKKTTTQKIKRYGDNTKIDDKKNND